MTAEELSEVYGFSVIPLNGKVPYEEKWTDWCIRKRPYDDSLYKKHNWGVCGGPASNLIILDVDSVQRFKELAAENGWETPPTFTVRSGKGYHLYYRYVDNGGVYGCSAHKENDVTIFDIKGCGGQVVGPGSIHPETKKIYEVVRNIDIASPPQWILDRCRQVEEQATASSTTRIACSDGWDGNIESLPLSEETKTLIVLGADKPNRSEAIMTVVNGLVWSNLTDQQIFDIFDRYPIGDKYREKRKNKTKWLQKHIKKAKQFVTDRADMTHRIFQQDVTNVTSVTNVTDVTNVSECYQMLPNVTKIAYGQMTTIVRQWLDGMEGQFHYRELAQDLQLNNKTQLQNLKMILSRLVSENVLERSGLRTGQYRIRKAQLVKLDWKNASFQEYPMELPLDLSDVVKLHPKNVAIVAGDRNSAKTAFLMNLAAMNAHKLECHYFSSEMGPEEYRSRIEEFLVNTGYPSDVWDRVNVWDRNADFQDVIVPDALNIIDFLEIENEFWRVNEKIARIWERLTTGVAFIGLQKKIGAEHGRGGDFSAEKARLYITFSLDETPEGVTNVGKIVKCKAYRGENPNGWRSRFKVFKGSRLIPVSPWCYPKH